MKKIAEFEQMARDMVGDGLVPNLFFVSCKGTIGMITGDFQAAYDYWKALPKTMETTLEDRQWGVIADTSPDEDNSKLLVTWDDSRAFLKKSKKVA